MKRGEKEIKWEWERKQKWEEKEKETRNKKEKQERDGQWNETEKWSEIKDKVKLSTKENGRQSEVEGKRRNWSGDYEEKK